MRPLSPVPALIPGESPSPPSTTNDYVPWYAAADGSTNAFRALMSRSSMKKAI
jgi:hypothetical protein